MSDYRIDIVGKFGNLEIRSIVDAHGKYWFTQEVIAEALSVDRTTLTKARQNHPEFFDDDDFGTILFEGRHRVVFSEEGFLTICDLSGSEDAVRLRKWMRQQFRVKQRDGEIVVQAKKLPDDDLSDLDPELAVIQRMLNQIYENRRRVRLLEADQRVIIDAQETIKSHVAELESRVEAWEEGAKLHPGEMTAIQLALHCGWCSKSGGPHNLAVILAALNENYLERKLMEPRREQGPDGRIVEVFVFTPAGITAFVVEVDSQYAPGTVFEIAPNMIAQKRGNKNKRTVIKRSNAAAAHSHPPAPAPAKPVAPRPAGAKRSVA
jgi:prophage antirepressor-like protein